MCSAEQPCRPFPSQIARGKKSTNRAQKVYKVLSIKKPGFGYFTAYDKFLLLFSIHIISVMQFEVLEAAKHRVFHRAERVKTVDLVKM